MRKKPLFGLLTIVILLVTLPFLSACAEEAPPTPTPATPAPTVSSPTSTPAANWWDGFGEPKYGGTITLGTSIFRACFDPYSQESGTLMGYLETLWIPDWTVDREIWSFKTTYYPEEYMTGCLVESWEIPDDHTVSVKIREGITWQDKPPVNGREFTAYDVEYHYNRLLGVGDGFTELSPLHGQRMAALEKATATGEYTVDFSFVGNSAINLQSTILEYDSRNAIEAREVIEEFGDALDWRNAVGTGPWMLDDFVDGSSATYVRNPDYWGYDERHPENQLPYVDELVELNIPDSATRLAALRTGQIVMDSGVDLTLMQALEESNPELIKSIGPAMGCGLYVNMEREPFTDIRVRKALQMAIDRPLMAETLYLGLVDGTPCGHINPVHPGYNYPYEDWPQELKDEYAYNPTQAKQLLEEAGYADGFEFTLNVASTEDLNPVQIFKSEFADIGVDMQIEARDRATDSALARAFNYDAWWSRNTAIIANPMVVLRLYQSDGEINYARANDPVYDQLCDDLNNAKDMDEVKRICQQMDQYQIENHWVIRPFPTPTVTFYQPYLKGYSGEHEYVFMWARCWID